MKIIGIFAVMEGSLYAVRYDDEDRYETAEEHEWSLCFDRWNDPFYLRNFFEEHKNDLGSDFWKGISIQEAVKKTKRDAQKLEEKLLTIAEEGLYNDNEILADYFKPLSDSPYEDQKEKAYGVLNPSWLRIYAVRINPHFYLISGSGIKLTKTMNEREHLQKELDKLEVTQNYIADNDLGELFELY